MTGMAALAYLIGCTANVEDSTTPADLPPATVGLLETPAATDSLNDGEQELGLSVDEVDSLRSLRKVADYPLYTMHYYGNYDESSTVDSSSHPVINELVSSTETRPETIWACSLFAAFGDVDGILYGRNFDWRYSPALFLYTDPPDGYASVSMVDIEYLGFEGAGSQNMEKLSLADRQRQLEAPHIPFDGMNEQGLVVAMAAVPPGEMVPEPNKEVIGSLEVIREMLDHASNTEEAVTIISGYNVDMGGGPPLHYLISDAAGQGVLVEFYKGAMIVIANNSAWHRATNFLVSAFDDDPEGTCWRYDEIGRRLEETNDYITSQEAMNLLQDVSQDNTQWSIVYGLSDGEVQVAMGGEYDRVYSFELNMVDGESKQDYITGLYLRPGGPCISR